MSKAVAETGRIWCELQRLEPWMATAPVTLRGLHFEAFYAMCDSWYLVRNSIVRNLLRSILRHTESMEDR